MKVFRFSKEPTNGLPYVTKGWGQPSCLRERFGSVNSRRLENLRGAFTQRAAVSGVEEPDIGCQCYLPEEVP